MAVARSREGERKKRAEEAARLPTRPRARAGAGVAAAVRRCSIPNERRPDRGRRGEEYNAKCIRKERQQAHMVGLLKLLI